jgi:mRNA-degrading endonuclease RelE of RelBE toxin-antitoxin system
MIVTFNKKFAKDLQSINDSKLKTGIKEFILILESTANLEGVSNIKRLRGFQNTFRYRIGDYRIGFYYENNEIELVRVVKRNDIYKVFP